MLDISDEVKTYFLRDSSPKDLIIDVETKDNLTLSDFNYYLGSVGYGYGQDITIGVDGYYGIFCDSAGGFITDFKSYAETSYAKYKKLLRASFFMRISNITSNSGTLECRLNIVRKNGDWDYVNTIVNVNDFLDRKKLDFAGIETVKNGNEIDYIRLLEFHNVSNTPLTCHVEIGNFQVELADSVEEFPSVYIDRFTQGENLNNYIATGSLTNEDISYESFSLTESLCSQDDIKFGLCESATCSFEVVGNDMTLKEKVIRPYLVKKDASSVPYEAIHQINWHKDISGWMKPTTTFTTARTSQNLGGRQYTLQWLFDTEISQYDDYFNKYEQIAMSFKMKITDLQMIQGDLPAKILVYVRIKYEDGYEVGYGGGKGNILSIIDINQLTNDYVKVICFAPYYLEEHGKITTIIRPTWYFLKADETRVAESENIIANYSTNVKEFQVNICKEEMELIPNFSVDDCVIYNNTLDKYIDEHTVSIPLGVFKVDSVVNSYNKNIKRQKVTAFDKMTVLSNNSADWYTQYMFGITTNNQKFGIEFPRQIYSTYFNYARSVGLEERDAPETVIASYTYAELKASHLSNKYISWDSTETVKKIRYCTVNVQDVNPNKLYVVDFDNPLGETDAELIKGMPKDFVEVFDSLGRGVGTNASILIEENRQKEDGTLYQNRYCCNKGDYFMISPNCVSFNVYTPIWSSYDNGTGLMRTLDNLKISEVDKFVYLQNGWIRLLYYNWLTKEIFECESSLTGRDVIRSLIEVCGCFFRLDRKNGKPEFVYCTKAGLYPSNILYPSDDIYPRTGTDALVFSSRYIDSLFEDYSVKDYGRIQIIKKSTSNETKSICEWQYQGDKDKPNTYLIDDNIFYCNSEMEYEYDSMVEVSEMLENMYLMICNLGFTPNTTTVLGMPWLECGDRVGLVTQKSGFESFVFRRTLNGINMLIDTYESSGIEINEAVNDFGYKEL